MIFLKIVLTTCALIYICVFLVRYGIAKIEDHIKNKRDARTAMIARAESQHAAITRGDVAAGTYGDYTPAVEAYCVSGELPKPTPRPKPARRKRGKTIEVTSFGGEVFKLVRI